MRDIKLAEGEYYHIFNRGVDKRRIFQNKNDYERFMEGIKNFNTIDSVGNMNRSKPNEEKVVSIVAYCLNSNHFHLILTPLIENGIERFMHKLSMGYAKYFNTKYQRSGALFQGRFKAKHVDSNEYLLHLSSYVNLNNEAHKLLEGRSSWDEYLREVDDSICSKEIILSQFDSRKEYENFARKTLNEISKRKELLKSLQEELLPLTPGVNIFL